MKLLTKINLLVVFVVALVFLLTFFALWLLGGSARDLSIILSIAALSLIITLLVFLGGLIHHKIFEPIAEYSFFVKKVSEGDLHQKIDSPDRTEVGKLGTLLNTMIEKLREIDAVKSSFNSTAAHQLRTPLSGLKWVLKYLLDGDAGNMNPEQQEMLKRGYDANEKMLQMVNNLLYVSRIENGKFGYEFKKNDFNTLLDTLRTNSEIALKEHNLDFHIENRALALIPFVFDFDNLLIALQNIVDNAIKYTPAGGVVRLSVDLKGDVLELHIGDNGVGVPREELPKLFSKFFRASNAVRLQSEGTGLGLFIVKNIIERHLGTISVESVEGKGTTFSIAIPTTLTGDPKIQDF